jgi:hypothetical protein
VVLGILEIRTTLQTADFTGGLPDWHKECRNPTSATRPPRLRFISLSKAIATTTPSPSSLEKLRILIEESFPVGPVRKLRVECLRILQGTAVTGSTVTATLVVARFLAPSVTDKVMVPFVIFAVAVGDR